MLDELIYEELQRDIDDLKMAQLYFPHRWKEFQERINELQEAQNECR